MIAIDGKTLRRSFDAADSRAAIHMVNFSILRRAALGMLKNEATLKVGIKNKRLTAAWDEAYLEKVLTG